MDFVVAQIKNCKIKAEWRANLIERQHSLHPNEQFRAESDQSQPKLPFDSTCNSLKRESGTALINTMEPIKTKNSQSDFTQTWSEQKRLSLNCQIQVPFEKNSHLKCKQLKWSHRPVMGNKSKRSNNATQHVNPRLHLNAISSLAMLCAMVLLYHSVNCHVIQFPNGNAVNDYDIHNNKDNQRQHIADDRPSVWQQEPNSHDYGSQQGAWPYVGEKEADDDEVMADEPDPKAISDDKNMTGVCQTDKCIKASGTFSNSMDLKANPCDDFYQYTCANWVKDHPIPAYTKSWSHFQKVFYTIRGDIKAKLNSKEKLAAATGNRTVFNKLYDFFNACTNLDQRNINGYASLLKLIAELGGWPMIEYNWDPEMFQWEKTYVKLSQQGPPYKTRENIVNLGAFQIPRQESKFSYTFEGRRFANVAPTENSQSDRLKRTYKEVISIIKNSITPESEHFNVTAFEDSTYLDEKLEKIYNLQEELQNSAQPMLSLEFYQSNYTKYLKNINEIQQLVSFNIIDLVKQMFDITLTEKQQLFVPDIKYLKELDSFLNKTPKSDLADYFVTNLVMNLASFTTIDMVDRLIAKVESVDTLENICYDQTANYLPELLGKLYLEDQGEIQVSKWHRDVDELAKLLHDSFREQLSKNGWMDESTINAAITKLDSMSMNIGFPDWYTNNTLFEEYCSTFTDISQEDFFNSAVSVSRASQSLSMQDLNERLHFSALTNWPGRRQIIDVNAFYFFATNGVYIPASIAQPPFWEESLPKSILFGSMGMIIGHEMTHAFDNTGRLYDYQGALRNWWSPQTAVSFLNKTDCFARQYSNFTISNQRINGNRTLSENIADNGGLREAYRAFKNYEKNSADTYYRMPGELKYFTPDQLFFISFANMWCSHMDTGILESDILQNAHSPPNIRVIGSLANFEEFAQAFNCPVGSKMNPEEKCILW